MRNPGYSQPPKDAVTLAINGCLEVNVASRTLNDLPSLKNLTFTKCEKVHLQKRIYESRTGTGETAKMENIEIAEVKRG